MLMHCENSSSASADGGGVESFICWTLVESGVRGVTGPVCLLLLRYFCSHPLDLRSCRSCTALVSGTRGIYKNFVFLLYEFFFFDRVQFNLLLFCPPSFTVCTLVHPLGRKTNKYSFYPSISLLPSLPPILHTHTRRKHGVQTKNHYSTQ